MRLPARSAVHFILPGGEKTDIVAMSHNSFVVATPAEFLALRHDGAKRQTLALAAATCE